jgi:DNA-directed RNA polymerase specialized sigma24 family protein
MNFAEIADGVARGEQESHVELYQLVLRFLPWASRKLGCPDAAHDVIQDAYLITVKTVTSGGIANPAALIGFIKTCVRRGIASHIDALVKTRFVSPEDLAGRDVLDMVADTRPGAPVQIEKQQLILAARKALDQLEPLHRELLVRFYLHEQPPEVIRRDLRLTPTQYRLHKASAKVRFGRFAKQLLTVGRIKTVPRHHMLGKTLPDMTRRPRPQVVEISTIREALMKAAA